MRTRTLCLVASLFASSAVSSAQWVPQTVEGINPNCVVLSIAPVDEHVVWAVVDTNVIASPAPAFTPLVLRTTDGGTSWTVGTVNGLNSFFIFDITATDSNTAWVATNNLWNSGHIYKTTDGGLSWEEQANAQSVFVHFFDAQHGVRVNQTLIYTTTNGGASWDQVQNVPTFLPNEFNIIYSGTNGRANYGDTIWVGTSKGRVYRSADRGYVWTVSQTSLGQDAVINSLAFKDGRNGLVVSVLDGNTFNVVANKMARTTDGGETWTTVTAPATPSAASIAYVPGTAGSFMVVSPSDEGLIPGSALTTDGGVTWTMIDSIQYQSVSFVGPSAGWAGGISTLENAGIYKWAGSVLDVDERGTGRIPQEFALLQNYPNPFNPSTIIRYQLPIDNHVTLKVYDLLGREVAVLEDEKKLAGIHEVTWNASGLGSGLYFYRIQANGEDGRSFVQTRKMILVK